MNILIQIIIFVALFFSSASIAQIDNTVDKELNKCMDDNPSTQGMLECIDKAYEKWEGELYKYYRSLMEILDDTSKTSLQEEQRKWIEFRDIEFGILSRIYSKKEGTMFLPMQALDKMEIVKRRANDLKDYYELLTGY
jgi:uncharacterized protein YecT (DUF1311 family)